MLNINGKEVTDYDSYSKLNGEDIIAFMQTKPASDIQEFKTFAQSRMITKYNDGSLKERQPSFFELRNWVLEKYAPGITAPQSKRTVGKSLIDKIMEL